MSLKTIIKDLVSFNTESGKDTSHIIQYISDMLTKSNFKVLSIGEQPDLNLVALNQAAIDLAEKGEKFYAFSGHLDTVPGKGWEANPLEVREEDGKLYGLGVCDMKGPIACMLEALVSNHYTPGGIVLTHNEEPGLYGAREIVEICGNEHHELNNYLNHMKLIIGEPTGMKIGYTHKGVQDFVINIIGRSCHGSTPELGLNAIYAASRIALELEKLNNGTLKNTGSTVNVGTFRGGQALNVVAQDVETSQNDSRLCVEDPTERVIRLIQIKHRLTAKVQADRWPEPSHEFAVCLHDQTREAPDPVSEGGRRGQRIATQGVMSERFKMPGKRRKLRVDYPNSMLHGVGNEIGKRKEPIAHAPKRPVENDRSTTLHAHPNPAPG